eukprot:1812154-Pyramimonas_sp.AAC.1
MTRRLQGGARKRRGPRSWHAHFEEFYQAKEWWHPARFDEEAFLILLQHVLGQSGFGSKWDLCVFKKQTGGGTRTRRTPDSAEKSHQRRRQRKKQRQEK